MCRHLAYVGPPVSLARLITEPAHSLYEQSWRPARQQHGTVNADGFGVGWYPLPAELTGLVGPAPEGLYGGDTPPPPGSTDRAPAGDPYPPPAEAPSSSPEGRPGPAAGGGPTARGPYRSPSGAMEPSGGSPEQLASEQWPARYRRAVPIWADANLPDLLRMIHSGSVLAAVRSASEGTTQEESAAAPFGDGRWLFSHNGAVADWTRLPTTLSSAELLGLDAHSDSALLWAMVTRRLRQGEPPAGALAAVVREVAASRPTARLNFLLTDGRTITATAWGETLWYRVGPGTALVASEPDDEPGGTLGEWREVPDRSLLLATTAGVRIIPLRFSDPGSSPRPGSDPRPGNKEPHPMTKSRFTLDDRLPADYFTTTLRADVTDGLAAEPRTLPPKWFYDKRGSDLFEQITRLPEYYPTRAEQEILTRRAPEIAQLTRAATLIELGSGSSRKTRLLLDALTAGGTLRRYAPLDVSASALAEAGEAICRDYPSLEVAATVADFEIGLGLSDEPGPRLLAFLGSTIGNLDTDERLHFYRTLSRALSGDDQLLLGADLVKDPEVLIRAYDDAAGVTAEFNKNVLHVLNRELGADFEVDAFDHVARWNADEERIEMHLRARTAQTVKIPDLDLTVDFAAGEDVRTELCCKFRRDRLTAELHDGGFTVRHWWTDAPGRFALLLAVPN